MNHPTGLSTTRDGTVDHRSTGLKAGVLGLVAALLLLALHTAGKPGGGREPAPVANVTAAEAGPPIPVSTAPHSRYKRPHMTPGMRSYYASLWGVDNPKVHLTNSGNLVRFTAHVVNAERAKVLADERATPALVARRAGVALQVPQMENVGKLRQISAVENGKDVWMVFSNKGFPVRTGDRVDVVVGDFRVENLVVD